MILIDGGRGQLNTAVEALHGTPLEGVPLIALAKNPDQLFMTKVSQPIRFAANNSLLQLLQRIRDEVHRFAISGHRKRRIRRSIHSMLEDIPGIGSARRTALLNHFGSVENIMKASVDQLEEVSSINRSLAASIYRHLREQ